MSATTPDIACYDIILVNTSAGRDSQAALRVGAETARTAGVSERVPAVHCDLGRVEWEGTRDLAAEQAAHRPSPSSSTAETVETRRTRPEHQRKRWPGITLTTRWVHSDTRRQPRSAR